MKRLISFSQGRRHGEGIRVQFPPSFFVPPNFVAPRKLFRQFVLNVE